MTNTAWVGVVLAAIGFYFIWRDWKREQYHRDIDQALTIANHPSRRAARLRAWGSCDCGRWDTPTAEPWSHTPTRCQPMREQLRGHDR